MTADAARGTWLAGETLEAYVLHRRRSALVRFGACSTQRIRSCTSLTTKTLIRERLTLPLDDWLAITAVSSVVRQAVMAHLEGASGTAPTSVPPHTPEDCLAVVLSHASPVAQRRLAETFARLDGIRTRLWFVAETLALWAARVEPRAHAADE
jgi:hypothetical protein